MKGKIPHKIHLSLGKSFDWRSGKFCAGPVISFVKENSIDFFT